MEVRSSRFDSIFEEEIVSNREYSKQEKAG